LSEQTSTATNIIAVASINSNSHQSSFISSSTFEQQQKLEQQQQKEAAEVELADAALVYVDQLKRRWDLLAALDPGVPLEVHFIFFKLILVNELLS